MAAVGLRDLISKQVAENECGAGGLRIMVLPARFLDNIARGLTFSSAIREFCDNFRSKAGCWNAEALRLSIRMRVSSLQWLHDCYKQQLTRIEDLEPPQLLLPAACRACAPSPLLAR